MQHFPTPYGSDGQCTGFAWLQRWFDGLGACCTVHDAGGSDGQLLDCLQGVLPPWGWAIAAGCVALMIAVRPIYVWMQRRGLAK